MGINSFTLKMIAVFCMLIDHIGAFLFPQYVIFRVIGRIAFPIFAYTLVEGFIYTHDLRKYMCRMGLLAVVSEIPFDLVCSGRILEFGHQNVFFTLTLGLVMLYFFSRTPNKIEKYSMVILLFLLAEFLRTDYSSMGLLMILCFYLFRDSYGKRLLSIAMINILLMGYLQIFAVFAMIPIHFHNKKQGLRWKYFFYAFYPVHLILLYLIQRII